MEFICDCGKHVPDFKPWYYKLKATCKKCGRIIFIQINKPPKDKGGK